MSIISPKIRLGSDSWRGFPLWTANDIFREYSWDRVRTNAVVGKCVFIDFIGKIIIDIAGFSVSYDMAGNLLNDLEGKLEKL